MLFEQTKGPEQSVAEYRRTASILRGEALHALTDGKGDLCNRLFSRALALESDARAIEDGPVLVSEIAITV